MNVRQTPLTLGHRMREHVGRHMKRLSDLRVWPSAIAMRHISGPLIHVEQLTNPIKIAHLTDQHVGRVTPMHVQLAAINLVNQQNPDLVLLTGDFVCHSELYLEDLTYIVKQLKAPAFAVLGNHDHWTSASSVTKALKLGNVEVLANQNTIVRIGNDEIQLIGLDDAYTKHANVVHAVKGMKKNVATVGLSHIGEKADELWEHEVPLVLSGHTHGGQITVARLNELILGRLVGHKYIHGLYPQTIERPYKKAVYVGAGIGAAVMPLRLGECGKREVTIFELGKDAIGS